MSNELNEAKSAKQSMSRQSIIIGVVILGLVWCIAAVAIYSYMKKSRMELHLKEGDIDSVVINEDSPVYRDSLENYLVLKKGGTFHGVGIGDTYKAIYAAYKDIVTSIPSSKVILFSVDELLIRVFLEQPKDERGQRDLDFILSNPRSLKAGLIETVKVAKICIIDPKPMMDEWYTDLKLKHRIPLEVITMYALRFSHWRKQQLPLITLFANQLEKADTDTRHVIAQYIILLADNGYPVDKRSPYAAWRPLYPLIKYGEYDAACKLLEKGAKVRKVRVWDPPLHHAAMEYDDPNTNKNPALECVRALIKAGADVNAVTSFDGQTPLHRIKSKQIAECLIEHGADPLAVDKKGNSAFDILIESDKDSTYDKERVDLLFYLILKMKEKAKKEKRGIPINGKLFTRLYLKMKAGHKELQRFKDIIHFE